MAYIIEKKQCDLNKVKEYLPMEVVLKNCLSAELILSEDKNDYLELHRILNEIIVEGISYPHEKALNFEEFSQYYLSNEVFILKVKETQDIIGSFYIKPNFPGRCDHFCNGGFIVDKKFRGIGAGKFMGFIYLRLANLLGYKASFFNLVFSNNSAGLHLWRSLGFKELSLIPNVCRVKDGGYVDAYQFYYDLSLVNFLECFTF